MAWGVEGTNGPLLDMDLTLVLGHLQRILIGGEIGNEWNLVKDYSSGSLGALHESDWQWNKAGASRKGG